MFEEVSRDRWLNWYARLASKVGYCFAELEKLKLLDPEQESIYSALSWAEREDKVSLTYELTNGSTFYYYVRGAWDKTLKMDLARAKAAERLGLIDDQILSLAYAAQLLMRQHRVDYAKDLLGKIKELLCKYDVSDLTLYEVCNAECLYLLAMHDIDGVRSVWRSVNIEDLQSQLSIENWFAMCHYELGEYEEARAIFQHVLEEANKFGDHRGLIAVPIRIIRIDLDLGNIAKVADRLLDIREKANAIQDRRYLALIEQLYARFNILRGDLPAARTSLAVAIDLFERLGMRRELAETRQELARLEAQFAAPSPT